MLARVGHNMLVIPKAYPRPLAITAQSLMTVATLHLKRSRIKEAMMHVVLSSVTLMQPLMTETVRCDERSHLECNKSLAD
jgi:hypothetical protein